MLELETGMFEQQAIDTHFGEESRAWNDLYRWDDVLSVIHQEREVMAEQRIRALDLPATPQTLELGCGAGRMAVRLAQLGHNVQAVDTVPEMRELARSNAAAAGVGDRLRIAAADAHALQFENEQFDLVVALGVFPWLHSPGKAAQEVARVLLPGGYALVAADNTARILNFVDPMRNPALTPVERAVKRIASRTGLRQFGLRPTQYWPREIRRLFASAGLEPVVHTTFGFGPFTFFGIPLFSRRTARRGHRRLQRLADRGVPAIASMGAQHLLVARKTR
jgi:ubiquinone/menaquinone biosynthesis C-methylase UbiE